MKYLILFSAFCVANNQLLAMEIKAQKTDRPWVSYIIDNETSNVLTVAPHNSFMDQEKNYSYNCGNGFIRKSHRREISDYTLYEVPFRAYTLALNRERTFLAALAYKDAIIADDKEKTYCAALINVQKHPAKVFLLVGFKGITNVCDELFETVGFTNDAFIVREFGFQYVWELPKK